jgi:hypothetical protein
VKYFITTFLALSSTFCFAQDTSTPASLFPQSNTAQSPILIAEPEVVLQEATSVIIGEEEPLLETTSSANGRDTASGNDPDSTNNTKKINLDDAFNKHPKNLDRPGLLRGINLDLYERDIKLFSGFRLGNTDQVGRWVRLDYLISWRRGTRIPALATTSSAGTSLEDAGVLGLSTTSSLLGTNKLNDGTQPGGRIDFGRWIPGTETAIGARFYGLTDAGARLTFTDAIVTRPFFNVDAGEQQSLPVNYPSSESGILTVDSASEMFGSDVYIMRPWKSTGTARINFLTGYQFSRFSESISIHSISTNLDGRNGIPIGTQLEVRDAFRTSNEFHGWLVGLTTEIDGGNYTLSFLAKVGIGGVTHRISTSGSTTITDPGGGTSITDGLLVAASNQGTFEQSRFTTIPEFSARYTRHLNDALDFSVGYSLIYWGHAVQPGNQIDLNVDSTGNSGQPAMPFKIDHYWAQSLSMGITLRY